MTDPKLKAVLEDYLRKHEIVIYQLDGKIGISPDYRELSRYLKNHGFNTRKILISDIIDTILQIRRERSN